MATVKFAPAIHVLISCYSIFKQHEHGTYNMKTCLTLVSSCLSQIALKSIRRKRCTQNPSRNGPTAHVK